MKLGMTSEAPRVLVGREESGKQELLAKVGY